MPLPDNDKLARLEEQFRVQKQELFDRDPAAYCTQNGMGINSRGVTCDFRNVYLYRLFPYNPSLERPLTKYQDYVRSKKFPKGIATYVMAQASGNVITQIDQLIDEINLKIRQGTLDEQIAKSYYDQLEALCRSGI